MVYIEISIPYVHVSETIVIDSIHRNQLEISKAYVQGSETIVLDSIHRNQ